MIHVCFSLHDYEQIIKFYNVEKICAEEIEKIIYLDSDLILILDIGKFLLQINHWRLFQKWTTEETLQIFSNCAKTAA